jgi:hypothetical protein
MAKKDNTLLIVAALAAVAGIYFFTKKPAAALAPVIPMNPQLSNPNYLTSVENTSVSDIMSSLSSSGVSTSAPAPLQLTPPDAETLSPLDLDLVQQPPSSNERPIVSEENQDDV